MSSVGPCGRRSRSPMPGRESGEPPRTTPRLRLAHPGDQDGPPTSATPGRLRSQATQNRAPGVRVPGRPASSGCPQQPAHLVDLGRQIDPRDRRRSVQPTAPAAARHRRARAGSSASRGVGDQGRPIGLAWRPATPAGRPTASSTASIGHPQLTAQRETRQQLPGQVLHLHSALGGQHGQPVVALTRWSNAAASAPGSPQVSRRTRRVHQRQPGQGVRRRIPFFFACRDQKPRRSAAFALDTGTSGARGGEEHRHRRNHAGPVGSVTTSNTGPRCPGHAASPPWKGCPPSAASAPAHLPPVLGEHPHRARAHDAQIHRRVVDHPHLRSSADTRLRPDSCSAGDPLPPWSPKGGENLNTAPTHALDWARPRRAGSLPSSGHPLTSSGYQPNEATDAAIVTSPSLRGSGLNAT